MRFFIFIFIFVFSLIGHAETLKKLQWKDVYEASPNVDYEKKIYFLPWIRGYEKCQKSADIYADLYYQYFQKVKESDYLVKDKTPNKYDQAAEINLKIQDWYKKSPVQCRETLTTVFMAMSVWQTGHLSAEKGQGRKALPRDAYAEFVIALRNRKQIHLLTTKQREDFHAKSGLKESLWLKKNENGYALQGLYTCSNSEVWISDELPPGLFGGVLVHELDHLYRSKNDFRIQKSFLEKQKFKPIKTEETSLKEDILFDEALSLYAQTKFYNLESYSSDFDSKEIHDRWWKAYQSENLIGKALNDLMYMFKQRPEDAVKDMKEDVLTYLDSSYFKGLSLPYKFWSEDTITEYKYNSSSMSYAKRPHMLEFFLFWISRYRGDALIDFIEPILSREPSPSCLKRFKPEHLSVEHESFIGSQLGLSELGGPANTGVMPCLSTF